MIVIGMSLGPPWRVAVMIRCSILCMLRTNCSSSSCISIDTPTFCHSGVGGSCLLLGGACGDSIAIGYVVGVHGVVGFLDCGYVYFLRMHHVCYLLLFSPVNKVVWVYGGYA